MRFALTALLVLVLPVVGASQPPPPPSDVEARADSQGYLTLSWSAVDGANEYRIYRNDAHVATTSDTSWTDDPGLPVAVYEVSSVASGDEGARSEPVVAGFCAGVGLVVPPVIVRPAECVEGVHTTVEWLVDQVPI